MYVLLATLPPEPAGAEAPVRLDATLMFGGVALSDGISDRFVSTAALNAVHPSGIGVHAEAVGEIREEDAGFFIGGLSWNAPSFVAKLRAGTSTENESILPELYLEAGGTWISPPDDGYTISPVVTHRSYRNSASETALTLSGAKYIGAEDDRIWVAEGFGRLGVADPGGRVGFSVGGSLSYGEYDAWSVGTVIEGGLSRYENVLGNVPVSNGFVSIRPFASYRVSERLELLSRIEIVQSELYSAAGLFLGVRIATDLR